MPTDLDLLMARVEEINAKVPPLPAEDTDTLIAYHRASRARKSSGGPRPKGAALDLAAIMGKVIETSATKKASSFNLKVKL